MPNTLTYSPGLANREDSNRKSINADDLNNVAVSSGSEITFWDKQVPNDKVLHHGHGTRDRRDAFTSYMYFDLKATGSGSGNDGSNINGTIIQAITDSDQNRVLAWRDVGQSSELRDARTDDDRTERPVNYAVAPFAKPGRYLELRINATSGSDGYEIDNSENAGTDSSVQYQYGEIMA